MNGNSSGQRRAIVLRTGLSILICIAVVYGINREIAYSRQRAIAQNNEDTGKMITQLGAQDPQLRRSAAVKLGRLKNSGAVKPLVAALKDPDSEVRMDAAEALGMTQDPRAGMALIGALHDDDGQVRSAGAAALEALKDPELVTTMQDALRKHNLRAIWVFYPVFLREGNPRSEEDLIAALNEFGNDKNINDMVSDFLNCGNAKLEKAARNWATRHGYQVAQLYAGKNVKWGSAQ